MIQLRKVLASEFCVKVALPKVVFPWFHCCWIIRKQSYRILYKLPFNINIYETSLTNDIQQASGEVDNSSGTSFLKNHIEMTMSVRLYLSPDKDTTLDTISTGFLHVTSLVILD